MAALFAASRASSVSDCQTRPSLHKGKTFRVCSAAQPTHQSVGCSTGRAYATPSSAASADTSVNPPQDERSSVCSAHVCHSTVPEHERVQRRANSPAQTRRSIGHSGKGEACTASRSPTAARHIRHSTEPVAPPPPHYPIGSRNSLSVARVVLKLWHLAQVTEAARRSPAPNAAERPGPPSHVRWFERVRPTPLVRAA